MGSSGRRISTVFHHLLKSGSDCESVYQACTTARFNHQEARVPTIIAEPQAALYDEKIKIKFDNFPSCEKVTLHGEFVQGNKKKTKFASVGHYVTDEAGQVCLWKQESSGGTYTGLEPMGIIWSLQPAPGCLPYARMTMRFIDRPAFIQLQAYKGHLGLEDIYVSENKPIPLAEVTLERYLKSPDVSRIEVTDRNVRGVFFLPPGDGPFQGVIDMFGIAGGIIEYRAALLASRGFAVLSLPFFAYKDLPNSMFGVTFDFFEEAAKWLVSHPKVCSYGIGVVSVSKSTEIAYAMSAYLKEVSCVVAINGFQFYSHCDLYYKGEVLCIGSECDFTAMELSDEGIKTAKGFTFKDNLIPAWRGDAKHLIIFSEDDYQLQPKYHRLVVDAAPEDKKTNFEIVKYPGAGHLLEPPYTALCRATVNPVHDLLMLFGGRPKEHAHAQEDSWQRIQKFLHENIPLS